MWSGFTASCDALDMPAWYVVYALKYTSTQSTTTNDLTTKDRFAIFDRINKYTGRLTWYIRM